MFVFLVHIEMNLVCCCVCFAALEEHGQAVSTHLWEIVRSGHTHAKKNTRDTSQH